VSLISREFYFFSKQDIIWKPLVHNTWAVVDNKVTSEEFDWKLYFREKYTLKKCHLQSETYFKENSRCPEPRDCMGAVRARNKKIFMLGGHVGLIDGFNRMDDMWILDTDTHRFERIHPVSKPLAHSRMRVVTIDNKVYCFGGILQDKSKLNSIYTFDSDTKEWSEVPVVGTPPTRRCDPVMGVRGHKIYIYGGSEEQLEFPNDIHIFDVDKREWQQPPKKEGPWPTKRIGCVGGIIKNKLYVYGGGDYNKVSETYNALYYDIWSLDLETFTWTNEPATGPRPTGIVFMNSFILGHHLGITEGQKTNIYDTVSKTWSKLDIKGLQANGTCVKTDEALYFVGGYNNIRVDLEAFSFLNQGLSQNR